MTRVRISERSAETLFVALPDVVVAGDGTAHWWRVSGGAVVARGTGGEWIDTAPGTRVIGLAPATCVRTLPTAPDAATANIKQAIGVARNTAVEHSLGDPQTLHAVTAAVGDERLVTAVVANATMLEWLDWSDGLGARIDRIVPGAMVLPLGDDWVRATVGSDKLIGRGDLIIPDEPALVEALVEPGTEPALLDPDALDDALVRIAADPVPDLRSGRFAARRVIVDRSTLRQLGVLLLLIGLVTLVTTLIEIVRLDRSRATLDAQSFAAAQAVAGPEITLATAEAELSARASANSGGAMAAVVSGLLARLQAERDVSVTALGYSRGMLSATLAAASVEGINRTLLALQRDGYLVTAVPRQGSDGRSMADVTIRGAS